MQSSLLARRPRLACALLLAVAATATAHEHHMDNIPEGQGTSNDPIVRCSE